MHVQQSVLNGMLRNISDPKLREQYGNIISGKFPIKVYCMNPQKDPKTKKQFHPKKMHIGFIDRKGNCLDAQTVEKKTGRPIAGIETSRDRFDGRKGFRCYCGNWSIQAEEERGVLKQATAPRPPTKEEMEQIFERVQKSRKGPLQFINGTAEYDGFMLEEVRI